METFDANTDSTMASVPRPPLGGQVRPSLSETTNGPAVIFLISTACARFGANAALWNNSFPRRFFLRSFLAKDASV
jgi:hypothetical protein